MSKIHPNFQKSYENMKKIIKNPKVEKMYKNAQYKSGSKNLGKAKALEAMKNKYKK